MSLLAARRSSELEPFLHFDPDRIYNPLTDKALTVGEPGFRELVELHSGNGVSTRMGRRVRRELEKEGWLVPRRDSREGHRYRLKYVSLEANTHCNQGCYFCPVSTDPRENFVMSMEFYESVLAQLAEHRQTIEAVSMVHYNEPTAEPLFLDRLEALKHHGLQAAVLTNGTGLTPRRVDAILAMGGLRYLSVNLSTLDRGRYAEDRRGDHLDLVLRHLDYLKNRPLAEEMEIVVLGRGDELQALDFAAISERFAGSRFQMKQYEVMDRAGNVPLGIRPAKPYENLCGCEQTGSRPLQWVHITPHGKCVLCCQDYHDQYVVGDLHHETLDEILSGPRMALFRRWVYGLESAPDDFICRSCIYARTSDS